MVWNGFCTVREQMAIFCWLRFSQLCTIGVETFKKISFSKKKLEKFEIFKWSELDFAL